MPTSIWVFLESFGLSPHIEAYMASALWFGRIIDWLMRPRAEQETA